jgi:hypothetical protein
LRALVNFRNHKTGRCNPSRDALAFAAGYKSVRRIDDALCTLIRSQEHGGHGLVVRELRRWRGVQSSSLYWFTPRFYELLVAYEAELEGRAYHVRQSAKIAPCRVQLLPPNKGSSLSDPSPCSSSPNRSLREEEQPRAWAREETPPVVRSPERDERSRLSLTAYDAFAETFWPRRADKYGEPPGRRHRGDELAEEDRITLGAEVRNLIARGGAAAAERGVLLQPEAVAEELRAELADVWLEHTGRQRDDNDPGFLVVAHHPLERLLGDLTWASERALLRWESRLVKRRPKRGAGREAPPAAIEAMPKQPRRPTVFHEDFAPADFSHYVPPHLVPAVQVSAEPVAAPADEGEEVWIEDADVELEAGCLGQGGEEVESWAEDSEEEIEAAVAAEEGAQGAPWLQEGNGDAGPVATAIEEAEAELWPMNGDDDSNEPAPDPHERSELDAALAEFASLMAARGLAPPRRPARRTWRR